MTNDALWSEKRCETVLRGESIHVADLTSYAGTSSSSAVSDNVFVATFIRDTKVRVNMSHAWTVHAEWRKSYLARGILQQRFSSQRTCRPT